MRNFTRLLHILHLNAWRLSLRGVQRRSNLSQPGMRLLRRTKNFRRAMTNPKHISSFTKIHNNRLFIILFICCLTSFLPAQEGEKTTATDSLSTASQSDSTQKTFAKKKKKKSGKDFEDLIEDYEIIEGLFTFYRDADENKVYMEILPAQLNKVFLCNITRESAEGAIFDGGALLQQFPFFFKKVGKKIHFIEENLRIRAAEGSSINKAIARDISNSLKGVAKIASLPHESRGSFLIDINELFAKDFGNVNLLTGRSKMSFSLDKSGSYISRLKSFPKNSELEMTLHFKSSKPQSLLFTLADSRSMIHRYRFSLSEIPKSNYQPRQADSRIGHFTTIYQDYTSTLNEDPYQRYINRWHLEKSEPQFALSPPRQPIVYWIENTVPREYRDAIREGVLSWNSTFENIGFRDALVVREMPDDADWDPADIRYNTIRWIVKPGDAYAVGPFRANPYTGQIYDADIRISADVLRFQALSFSQFVEPSAWQSGRFPIPLFPEITADSLPVNAHSQCHYSRGMQQQMAFAQSILQSQPDMAIDSPRFQQFIRQALVNLVAHEVGHTLGLRHNFKGSTAYSLQKMQDENFVRKNGLTGSLMDYTAVNIAPDNRDGSARFQTRPGAYDQWAIEYAYRPYDARGNESETEMLRKIARRAAEKPLQYGTDEDAFGASTKAVDPHSNLWDLGDDPLEFYRLRLKLTRELWKNLEKKFRKEGGDYKKLRQVFNVGVAEYFMAGQIVSRYIGGLHHYRDRMGDPDGRPPFEVIPADKQREALQFLIKHFFQEESFRFSPEMLNRLGVEREMDFINSVNRIDRLDYPIHGIVQVLQATTLFRLFHHRAMVRMQDNEIRFEKGDPFTIAELLAAVRQAIWTEIQQGKNASSFRRELQRIHLYVLDDLIVRKTNFYPRDAVTMARDDLRVIKEMIEAQGDLSQFDAYTAAHLRETLAKVSATLEAQIIRR